MTSAPAPSVRRAPAALAALAALLLLAGCVSDPGPPAFYRDLAAPDAWVDTAAALSLVNDYRAKEGLGPLALDRTLVAVAEEQAEALAAAGEVRLSLAAERRLARRLEEAGFSADRAVENTSAGYRTLAEAFSGWRDSPGHNANMLAPDVDRFGIATAYAPGSKYRVFWTAVFASAAP